MSLSLAHSHKTSSQAFFEIDETDKKNAQVNIQHVLLCTSHQIHDFFLFKYPISVQNDTCVGRPHNDGGREINTRIKKKKKNKQTEKLTYEFHQ